MSGRRNAVTAMLALACGVAPVLAADTGVVKIMFGPETKEKWRTEFMDFLYVTPEARSEDGSACGWKTTEKVNGWIFANDRLCSIPTDTMLEHCIRCADGVLAVRVPDGPVAVHLWVGDMFKGIRSGMGSYQVRANGTLVVDEKLTFKNVVSERWWLRGFSEVYHKDTDPWTRQVKPILDEYDFDVAVTGGVLELAFKNVNLCALTVVPGGDPEVRKTVLEAIEQARRKEFAVRYPWKPQPDEPMPSATAADKARGFIVFQKLIDDRVYPWTRPVPAEIVDSIRVVAARGEQEAFRFGVLPLEPLASFSVEVGDFTGPGDAGIALAGQAEFFTERYAERGSRSTSGRSEDIRRLDPECDVLIERGPTDYEPGLPRMFTLDLRVPTDAPAGVYRAPVSFLRAGKPAGKAELALRVLPWELPPCPIPYTFQATTLHWTDRLREEQDMEWAREAQRKRIQFIGRYGFSASYFHPQHGWRRGWFRITGEPGSRHLTQTEAQAAEMDWWYRTVMNEGNAAGYWIQFHWGGFWRQAGWSLNYRTDGTGEITVQDRADLVTCIREYEEICRKKGYPKHYWYGSGEPDNFGLKGVERGNEMASVAREAGASTLCSLNGPIGNKLAPPLHDVVLANHATPITEEFIARVRALGHQFGAHNTGVSRFSAGYQTWRMDATTKFQEVFLYVAYTVPFTYLPWNYKAAAAFPTEDGGWRPTVRWLRYREGRDDYIYMRVLEERLARAKQAGLTETDAFRRADAFRSDMHERLSVDPRDYFAAAVDAKETDSGDSMGWTPKRYARYRWFVADCIGKLDEALQQGK